MNRNIEFRTNIWHWKMVLSMVTSYIIFTFIFNLLSETEFRLWPFLVAVTSMVVVYSALTLGRKSHLSVVGNEVFLRHLKAEVMAKRDIFGYQYIQITSNTESGYHRLKIARSQIAPSDWEFLLGKCI